MAMALVEAAAKTDCTKLNYRDESIISSGRGSCRTFSVQTATNEQWATQFSALAEMDEWTKALRRA